MKETQIAVTWSI